MNHDEDIIKFYNPWWNSDYSYTYKSNDSYRIYLKKVKRVSSIISMPMYSDKPEFIHLMIKRVIKSGVNPKSIIYIPLYKLIYIGLDYVKGILEKGEFKYIFIDEPESYYFFDKSDFVNFIKSLYAPNSIVMIFTNYSVESEMVKRISRLENFKTIKLLPPSFREFIALYGGSDLKKLIKNAEYSDDLKELYKNVSPLCDPSTKQKIKFLFDIYVDYGGFMNPTYRSENLPYESDSDEFKLKCRSSLKSKLVEVNDSVDYIDEFMENISKAYGSIYNSKSIESDLHINDVKMKYLWRVMKDLNLTINLSKFDMNKRKPVATTRKTYFTDNFIARAYSDSALKEGPIIESIVGTALYNNFKKVYILKDKYEVDFYVPSKHLGIEVKSGLAKVSDYKLNFPKKKIVLNSEFLRMDKDKNALMMPYYIFLITLPK